MEGKGRATGEPIGAYADRKSEHKPNTNPNGKPNTNPKGKPSPNPNRSEALTLNATARPKPKPGPPR